MHRNTLLRSSGDLRLSAFIRGDNDLVNKDPSLYTKVYSADANVAHLLQRYGFQDRADFSRHYQRLSEVLVRNSQWQADEPVIGWSSPQAKHPLPSKVRTALYRSHGVS